MGSSRAVIPTSVAFFFDSLVLKTFHLITGVISGFALDYFGGNYLESPFQRCFDYIIGFDQFSGSAHHSSKSIEQKRIDLSSDKEFGDWCSKWSEFGCLRNGFIGVFEFN